MYNYEAAAQAHMEYNPDNQAVGYHEGLTKLEHAAIQIMAGYMADRKAINSMESVAEISVRAAKALFAELEKGNG